MNDSMPTSRRAAPANSNPTGEFPAGAVGEFPANGLNTLSTEVRRFGVDEVLVGAAVIVTNDRTGVRLRGGVHSDVWPETVNVSAARPATARGEAIQSLRAGALFTNWFATTLSAPPSSVNEVSGDDARAAIRSARAARRSDSDDPPERGVVRTEVLSPSTAPAAFPSASVTRFAVASAASDSRRTIDVAVTELGVVSVARWRPMMSAMREGLTSILPRSSVALSSTAPVLSPEPSPVCELSGEGSPSAVAIAMPCP